LRLDNRLTRALLRKLLRKSDGLVGEMLPQGAELLILLRLLRSHAESVHLYTEFLLVCGHGGIEGGVVFIDGDCLLCPLRQLLFVSVGAVIDVVLD
jgi:hypothetical protein